MWSLWREVFMRVDIHRFNRAVGLNSLLMVSLYALFGLLSTLYFYKEFSWVNLLISLAGAGFLLVLFAFFSKYVDLLKNKNVIYLSLLCFFVFIALMMQRALGVDTIDSMGRSAYGFAFSAFLVSFVWMLAGAAFQFYDFKKNNFLSILIVLLLAFLISRNVVDGLVISYWEINLAMGSDTATHLLIGDYVLFFVVLSLALAGTNLRLVIFPVLLIVLFAVGSRTIFYLFALCWILHYLIFVNFRVGTIYFSTFVFVLIGFVVPYLALTESDQLLSRMLFSDGLESDDSFADRIRLLIDALSILGDQALYGGLAIIADNFGTIGAYMHNVLSAWQFYGFIPFVLILILFFSISKHLWLNRRNLTLRVDYFGSLMFVYVLFASLLSRSVAYNLMWFIFGFWVMKISLNKYASTR